VDLLLKDGTEYSGLSQPPEDLNVESSRRMEPQKWHHWKQAGSGYLVDNGGNWAKLDGDRVRPLASGSALSASLTHRSAVTFGGMGGTTGTSQIRFSPTGQFERNSSTLAGSGVVQSSAGFSGGASSYSDRNGRRSSAFGTNTSGGSSVTATSSSASPRGAGSASGTYKVYGYTLELDCANGQVQRLLAFYPFPGDPRVYIGDTTFSVADGR
jgi:hypothetical protein